MPFTLPTLAELASAATLIYRHMPPTPQYRWPLLEEAAGTEVWLKHENHTPVGAFKIRGGLVIMDSLRHTHPQITGVVSATRGNHGQSIAFAARLTGQHAVIVVPHGNSLEKNAAMRALVAELIEAGVDFRDACDHADRLALERSLYRLPSFDALLVRGVGTYALEFFRAICAAGPAPDVVFVPVGMGSGVCGMIAARDALALPTQIIGVVSTGAPAYQLSFAVRRVVEHPVTTILADGMACRTPHTDALQAILQGVHKIAAVTDEEVAEAMRLLFRTTHNVAEGAGAASLAALMQQCESLRGKRVGIVLCGGNVDSEVFARVLAA